MYTFSGACGWSCVLWDGVIIMITVKKDEYERSLRESNTHSKPYSLTEDKE